MLTIKAKYQNVHRQTRSSGCATLRLPLKQLWRSYVTRFAQEGLSQLASGPTRDESQVELEASGLYHEALSLEEWFPPTSPPEFVWDGRLTGLRKLAGTLDDLASDGGAWRDEVGDREMAVETAVTEMLDRLRLMADRVRRQHGPAAARILLNDVRRTMDSVRTDLETTSERWSAADSELLRDQAERLRRYAQLRGKFAPLVIRIWPHASVRFLLSDGPQRNIGRILKSLSAASHRRSCGAIRDARLQALRELLGTAEDPANQIVEQPGRIDELLESINREVNDLRMLSTALASQVPRASRVSATELRLVETLDCVIDPQNRRTMRDLYDERVSRAGCSPPHWAESLRHEGLPVGTKSLLPHEWDHQEPTLFAAALLRSAHEYLGLGDAAASLNVEDPQTAIEHVAGLTLLSEELRPLLQKFLPQLIRRSRPFATFRQITGAEPKVHRFLYCHPSERTAWEKLLRMQVQIAEVADPQAYGLQHPYAVVVAQYPLGAPGGAMQEFWNWMATGNQARRSQLVTPLYDRRSYPEVRLLDERVKEHEDCQQLLVAARKASIVHPVGDASACNALTKPDSRLEHLFSTRILVPQWRDANFFHTLLNLDASFVDFVLQRFPQISGFRQIALRLRREQDTEAVAEELTQLGILERGPYQFCISQVPPQGRLDMPDGLYSVEFGSLHGLAPDEFIAALYQNDLLYNVLFWGVCDALQLGLLSENDVPESVRRFVDSLGLN